MTLTEQESPGNFDL